MTLPSIRLSDNELASGILHASTRLLSRQVFASQGVLAIENAFAAEFIVSLKDAFTTAYASHLVDRESEETLKVGDKRIMAAVEISGQFNTPYLYANPFVYRLVQDILGEDCLLRGFGAVTALPGAEEQHVHRDHPFLFEVEAIDTSMPAFALNAMIPLVDIGGEHGTTRVWPGSHRVWSDDEASRLPPQDPVLPIGSCVLMDYRLLHGGTENRSERVRPLLYAVYSRPWFKDYVNFGKVRELQVSAEAYAEVPEGFRKWFAASGQSKDEYVHD